MRTFGLVGILFWIAFMYIISRNRGLLKTEVICGMNKLRYKRFFAILVFLPVILWAGFRGGQGYVDTNAYILFFNSIPTGIKNIINYVSNVHDSDPGFSIFAFIIKTIFGESYVPFIFIIALIEGLSVVFFYRKYSPSYVMSIFLFIASVEYFTWMFNGIRQFLAVSIIIAAFPLYLKKKYIRYILFVLLACTIHMTAVIIIPIAIVSIGKPWNYKTIIALVLTIVILMTTNSFVGFLDSAVQNTQYSDSVSSWIDSGDDGTNPVRVLVYAVPPVLAFIGRRKLSALNDPVLNVSVNMSIISFAIWLISMVTSGIYMGRLPIYASMFNYILLPYEIEVLFNKNSAKLMNLLLVLFYLSFYYYQLHFVWRVI